MEVETENYLKMDPDPFDERHPSRTDPSGTLGQVLKALFRKENFTNKVGKNSYLLSATLTKSFNFLLIQFSQIKASVLIRIL